MSILEEAANEAGRADWLWAHPKGPRPQASWALIEKSMARRLFCSYERLLFISFPGDSTVDVFFVGLSVLRSMRRMGQR